MSDQPSQPRESGNPESGMPQGLEPPRFAPPYGSGTPAPPRNGQGYDGFGQNAYGEPGQFGGTYGQPPSPYNQPAGTYSQAAGPYAPQAYYGMPAEPKTLSIASMVCGIASVIMGWILLPQIAAIVTGHLALRREPSGRGMSITGLVLGYLCLLGYGAFWLLVVIGLAIASSTTGPSYTF